MPTWSQRDGSDVPTVVNRHHYKKGELPRPWTYVGRGTPLGNPFTVQEHGQNALELYRRWLWDKIRGSDPQVLSALADIREDTNLVCSCAPRPCHADVICRAWAWLQTQGWWRRRMPRAANSAGDKSSPSGNVPE